MRRSQESEDVRNTLNEIYNEGKFKTLWGAETKLVLNAEQDWFYIVLNHLVNREDRQKEINLRYMMFAYRHDLIIPMFSSTGHRVGITLWSKKVPVFNKATVSAAFKNVHGYAVPDNYLFRNLRLGVSAKSDGIGVKYVMTQHYQGIAKLKEQISHLETIPETPERFLDIFHSQIMSDPWTYEYEVENNPQKFYSTYDKVNIQRWLDDNTTDPLTRRSVQITDFKPNKTLHEEIKNFLKEIRKKKKKNDQFRKIEFEMLAITYKQQLLERLIQKDERGFKSVFDWNRIQGGLRGSNQLMGYLSIFGVIPSSTSGVTFSLKHLNLNEWAKYLYRKELDSTHAFITTRIKKLVFVRGGSTGLPSVHEFRSAYVLSADQYNMATYIVSAKFQNANFYSFRKSEIEYGFDIKSPTVVSNRLILKYYEPRFYIFNPLSIDIRKIFKIIKEPQMDHGITYTPQVEIEIAKILVHRTIYVNEGVTEYMFSLFRYLNLVNKGKVKFLTFLKEKANIDSFLFIRKFMNKNVDHKTPKKRTKREKRKRKKKKKKKKRELKRSKKGLKEIRNELKKTYENIKTPTSRNIWKNFQEQVAKAIIELGKWEPVKSHQEFIRILNNGIRTNNTPEFKFYLDGIVQGLGLLEEPGDGGGRVEDFIVDFIKQIKEQNKIKERTSEIANEHLREVAQIRESLARLQEEQDMVIAQRENLLKRKRETAVSKWAPPKKKIRISAKVGARTRFEWIRQSNRDEGEENRLSFPCMNCGNSAHMVCSQCENVAYCGLKCFNSVEREDHEMLGHKSKQQQQTVLGLIETFPQGFENFMKDQQDGVEFGVRDARNTLFSFMYLYISPKVLQNMFSSLQNKSQSLLTPQEKFFLPRMRNGLLDNVSNGVVFEQRTDMNRELLSSIIIGDLSRFKQVLNISSSPKSIPLSFATYLGYSEMVDLLLDDENMESSDDMSSVNMSIVFGAMWGRDEILKTILNHKKLQDRIDPGAYNQRALWMAVKYGNLSTVKLLMGTDIDWWKGKTQVIDAVKKRALKTLNNQDVLTFLKISRV